jgi:hypothetical protein
MQLTARDRADYKQGMKVIRSVGAGALILGVSAVAMAAQWSSTVTIQRLEAGHGADMYRVYPASGSATNPASCSGSNYYEIQSNEPAATRELYARTLLSAYLAGQKVQIYVSSDTCSDSSRPTIAGVRLDTTF